MSADSPFIALVRPADLLALTFELVNLVIDETQPAAQLVRVQADQDAFLIVHFPPQHIGEPSFTANGSSSTIDHPPVKGVLAGPSRLAFRLPPNTTAVPLTVAALLDWSHYQLVVPSNALPDLGIDFRFITDPSVTRDLPGPHDPAPTETAIELPYRIVISPDNTAVWAHSATAVSSPQGRTELWHTRLSSTGTDFVPATAVRAIWTPDLLQENPSGSISPDGNQRRDIVSQCSDFTQQIGLFKFYVPRPLKTEKLILSALGGWLDANASWQFPFPNTFNVTEWRHIAHMGRDQYVRVVEHGFLYPTCHRAAHIEVTQRELAQSATFGITAEYLVRRSYVAPLELEKDYELVKQAYASSHGEGGEMPLRRLRLKTLITAELVNDSPDSPFVIQDPFGDISFHFEGEDWEGGQIDFNLPLVFVPAERAADSGSLSIARGLLGTVDTDARGQLLAFAHTSDKPGSTTLPTSSFRLSAQDATSAKVPGDLTTGLNAAALPLGHAPFLPVLAQASVNIPAVDAFLGSSNAPGPQTIRLSDTYLDYGLVTAASDGDASKEVFAKFINPVSLSFPKDKIGGLADPTMQVTDLSRALGPVPNLSNLDLNSLLNSLDGNLIGGITLKQLLGVVTGGDSFSTPPSPLQQIPGLTTTVDGQTVTTTFQWSPKVVLINDPSDNRTQQSLVPLVTTKDTTLNIMAKAIASISGGDPDFDVVGTLSNFALNFLPGAQAVQVSFEQLQFHARKGSKPDLAPKGVVVEFVGVLAFVRTLAELLPSDGFNDPPVLSVSPSGITAGYTLGIPAAGAGVFSLQDIAISAALELPFDHRPVALRLNFSERFHPFIVTISFVGGGGSFTISISTHGVDMIEGSLELGGNITIGLGIVEANAHVMGGLFFHWDVTEIYFSAYLRVGASVEILGIVGISIDIYLGLTFTPTKLLPDPLKSQMISNNVVGIVGGIASVSVGLHVLFVTKTLTLTLERRFEIPTSFRLPVLGTADPGQLPLAGQLLAIAEDPTFDDTVTLCDWRAYCQAFAQE
jgi:hypothetical protein